MRAKCWLPLVVLLLAGSAPGLELWSRSDLHHYLTLSPTLKSTGLLVHHLDEPILFPHEWSGLGLGRLRLDLHARWADAWDAGVAYEFSAGWYNQHDGTTDVLRELPISLPTPFRLGSVQDEWGEGRRWYGLRELDRAFVAWHPSWGEVVLGRQAIGLGRGVLFSAIDLFSPFSPLEVDREWRSGVDAARVEWRLSPNSSAEAIGVAGESWDESAFVLRLRGYLGLMDGEILGGRRGTDDFVGAAFSAAAGDAETHAEVAVFRTRDDHPQGSVLGSGDLVPKAVVGGSYTLNVGNGLTVLGEYHYSGFASRHAEEAQELFASEEYAARYLRGDTQILCRHAAGLQLSYPVNESISATVNAIVNARDGSGVLSPSVRWDVNRNLSLTVAGYVGWGEQPVNAMLRSEYGATGQSLFFQVGLYF